MTITRYSPRRIVAVTLGLSAAGAVFGGLAGSASLGVALVLSEGVAGFKGLRVLAIPGVIGAVLGSVCAPLAGWLLLRRVPLGRAFAGLTVGTIVGGLAGWFFPAWFLPATFDPVTQPIVAAGAGFLGATVLLRVQHARKDAQLTPGTGDGAT